MKLRGGVRSSTGELCGACGVRVVKLGGQDRYLARGRTYEPGSYFELSVSPWGHVRCTCLGFTYRGVCKHVEALRDKLNKRHSSPGRLGGGS